MTSFPTSMTHQFAIYCYDRKKGRLSWSFRRTDFSGLHLCFVSSILWNCRANGQAVLFSKQLFKIQEKTQVHSLIFFFFYIWTVLYLLRKQIIWHFCIIFYSEMSQCFAFINKSNLCSSTNGKLRDRSWFLGPSGSLCQNQKYNLMSWFPVQYSDSKEALSRHI